MNNKIVILITALCLNNIIIGMESQKSTSMESQQSALLEYINALSGDMQKEIQKYIIPHQWWYLKTFQHNHPVYSICFDGTGKLFATGCGDNKARIFDIQTNKETSSFQHSNWVTSVCFDGARKRLATGCYDSKARIFAQHDDYTTQQLQLKKALLTWLLIEKPNKQIDSLEKLLVDTALKCTIDYNELIKAWSTFPDNMQAALWRTMVYRIKEYGKVAQLYKQTNQTITITKDMLHEQQNHSFPHYCTIQ